MNKQKALDIVNCVGGICATSEEVKKAKSVLGLEVMKERHELIGKINIVLTNMNIDELKKTWESTLSVLRRDGDEIRWRDSGMHIHLDNEDEQ